ncbi:hypothetical protein CTAYLR_009240 [Chrysophaeum taylorii]|uniref:Uncharacterized protein n=1 Tax=Chrysophaeum taylorii TaxID=2483200 RepID=A0AAD7UIF7_9STRA|nr:hypothetical protein CTAYLR_009240 [Chrysophaeum taylorii]
MFSKVVLALCLTSAAAFAPVASHAAPKTVVKAFETELGVQAPLGFFDPLGLLADADQEKFERLRYVEIKHGRISMLAVLGQIVTKAGIFLPGTIDYSGTKFSDVPTGFGAFSAIQPAGIAQIVAFVGFLELFVMKDSANGAAPGEFPGDFRNGALDFGWDTFSAEEKLSKRAIELNNGRAAMMGILALMVHEELGSGTYHATVAACFLRGPRLVLRSRERGCCGHFDPVAPRLYTFALRALELYLRIVLRSWASMPHKLHFGPFVMYSLGNS